jgi:hypothetical protein
MALPLRGKTLEQEATGAVENEDVGGTEVLALPQRLSPRHGPHLFVPLVHRVDQGLWARCGHHSLLFQGAAAPIPPPKFSFTTKGAEYK